MHYHKIVCVFNMCSTKCSVKCSTVLWGNERGPEVMASIPIFRDISTLPLPTKGTVSKPSSYPVCSDGPLQQKTLPTPLALFFSYYVPFKLIFLNIMQSCVSRNETFQNISYTRVYWAYIAFNSDCTWLTNKPVLLMRILI